MPECVSVSEFLQEVQEDWSSPTTSSFTSKMLSCRNTVYLLEEVSADTGVVVVWCCGSSGLDIYHLVASISLMNETNQLCLFLLLYIQGRTEPLWGPQGTNELLGPH